MDNFTPFSNETESYEDLPWLADYVKSNPTAIGALYQVFGFSFGKKGVLLETLEFKTFFYKSSPIHRHLSQWVGEGVSTNKNFQTKAPVVIKVTNKAPTYAQVGCSSSVQCYLTQQGEGKYRTVRATVNDVVETQGLPTLEATPSTPVSSTSDSPIYATPGDTAPSSDLNNTPAKNPPQSRRKSPRSPSKVA